MSAENLSGSGGHEEAPQFVFGAIDEFTVRPNGQVDVGMFAASTSGMSEEQVKEVVADNYGITPDQISATRVDPETGQPIGGRKHSSASFSRWNSSWDPRAERPEHPEYN